VIPARLAGTGSHLAGRLVATREVAERAMPGKDPAEIERRIGIATRYWVEPGTTCADTAAAALRMALDRAGLAASALRRLVFVSSTGGDTLIPATAHLVCDRLGLDDTCDAFDVNNSCAGFLTGLDLAARSVATGSGPVGVVVGEIFSRFLPAEKPRPYLVMGDAAAAAVIVPARDGEREGLLASALWSAADLRREVTMDHPGRTGAPPFLQFDATYEDLTASAVHALLKSSRAALDQAELALDDVAWFLPHQPNGWMLERILAAIGLPADRTIAVVGEIGSVGAASVPVSLDRLMRSGRVRPGDRILMAAVGAGTGYGALLFQVGA